jgi:hypothetical protein
LQLGLNVIVVHFPVGLYGIHGSRERHEQNAQDDLKDNHDFSDERHRRTPDRLISILVYARICRRCTVALWARSVFLDGPGSIRR